MTRPVYPRVCGGTRIAQLDEQQREGLSPRVRGNPMARIRQTGFLRSIPACAGEPVRAGSIYYCPGVYPRVCGGTRILLNRRQRRQGLSPRVRGNLPPPAVRAASV